MSASTQAPPPQRIALMSYNIRVGVESSLEALAQAVRREGVPDLLAMQEVGLRWRMGAAVDQNRYIATRLGLPHVAFAGALRDDLGGQFGVSLASRWPIEETIRLPLSRQKDEQRILLLCRLAQPLPVWVAVTHLSVEAEERLLQAEEVAEALRRCALPVILLGDLNDHPDSPTLRALAAWTDAFDTCGQGEPWTFSVREPHRRIDYIRCGPPLRFVGTTRVCLRARASDHFPLRAEIAYDKRSPKGPTPC